ncbi:MAG: nicotinate phosphoribosyltransferase [Nitrospinota bacterium]|nr:nicotinate phosphoribosyltransferase [Nitrospinota bacterium]
MNSASSLLTDYYQLTMMQGYFHCGLNIRKACFDIFFRRAPFNGGFTLAAGLEDAMDFLRNLKFGAEELEYLREDGSFGEEFLEYLGQMRISADVWAAPEGTVVFPLEPILRIMGPLDQLQLVESALLNIINFQTLVATKAARICLEAGRDNVMEFGLRRAQGFDGAMSATRAAHIGGCSATSNVAAARKLGIPAKGTHAHSWVTAFPGELEAFREFVNLYPDNAILLVDTYDTLKSGVPNAIKVAREMESRGRKLIGIRLDSGDLAFLSIEARRMLDQAGLADVKIMCSSELDEHIIHDLRIQGARIDAYGVGTRLVTADGDPSLTGVYKMAAMETDDGQWRMTMKKAEGLKKSTLPGVKQVYRLHEKTGEMMADLVELEGAAPDFTGPVKGVHPVIDGAHKVYEDIGHVEELLAPVMKNGEMVADLPELAMIRIRARDQLSRLHPTMRRLLNPHEYKVSLGPKLYTAAKKLRESTV